MCTFNHSIKVNGYGFGEKGSGSRFRPLEYRYHGLGFRVQGLGFGVQGSRSRIQSSVFRGKGSGCRVRGSGFRVRGSGFRVQGSGFRVQGSRFAGLTCAVCSPRTMTSDSSSALARRSASVRANTLRLQGSEVRFGVKRSLGLRV